MIFNYFSTTEERLNLEEKNYHSANICAAGKKKYYEFLKKVFPYLIKLIPFRACLSGNVMYIVQQEWSKVCEENNIPFIVLHKEAIVLPKIYQKFLDNYKNCKFFGSKILFYNRQCQEGFLSLNIEGLTVDKVGLVGIPRLDFCFANIGQKKENEKQIVFFSFLPRISFRFLIKDEDILRKLDEREKEFVKWIIDFALKHKNYNVIIKTKMASKYFDYPHKILVDNYKKNVDNLIITNTADPSQLIKNSRVVIGFNSTTLIEAIIANKLVISPFFGDIVNQEWSFFEGYDSLIKYVRNFDDLEKYILEEELKVKYEETEKKHFLEKYITAFKGDASLKAEGEIIKTIKQRNI